MHILLHRLQGGVESVVGQMIEVHHHIAGISGDMGFGAPALQHHPRHKRGHGSLQTAQFALQPLHPGGIATGFGTGKCGSRAAVLRGGGIQASAGNHPHHLSAA
ncbi:MAG: hypothetical protein NC388_05990 [Clostridium sp.]|nr:hypothetical protein [Clostridium sp.]